MKKLSLKDPMPHICDVEPVIKMIYNILKGRLNKDFQNDVFYSLKKIGKNYHECNMTLYKSDKNSTDYELIKAEFSDLLEEKEVYEKL
jgi:hypothetical protein